MNMYEYVYTTAVAFKSSYMIKACFSKNYTFDIIAMSNQRNLIVR